MTENYFIAKVEQSGASTPQVLSPINVERSFGDFEDNNVGVTKRKQTSAKESNLIKNS